MTRPASRLLARAGLPCHHLAKRRKLSYVRGDIEEPLDERTLPQAWSALVREHGDRPALVSRHEGTPTAPHLRWTYRQMGEQVDALANGLHGIGIRKGDRVATWQANSSANAALQWATAKVGAILVSVNPAFRQDELLRCLNLVQCKALFGVPTLRSSDYASILAAALPSLASSRPHELHDEAVPTLRSVVLADNVSTKQSGAFQQVLDGCSGFADYADVASSSSQCPFAEPDLRNDETINLQFTSGTTGHPKAVRLSHKNLLNNGAHIGARMRISNQDVLLNTPPLFHCFGIVLGNLAMWTHGGCVVYASEVFDPVATVRAIAEERATALHGVPTMFLNMLKVVDAVRAGVDPSLADIRLDFSTLRTGIAAGSPVPSPLMSLLTSPDSLNLRDLTIVFGQTESSPGTFMSRTDDPLQKRIDTVGRVLPHTQAKVTDPADPMRILPLGETGELQVSGYPVFEGYWANEAETAKVLLRDEEGKTWLRTGDLAALDDDGYLTIKGRLKDLIIRGGENLSPVVIENILLAHEDIADAAAIGVPDDLLGETVGLFVQRRHPPRAGHPPLTRDTVRAHVRARWPQATPTWIWFLGDEGGDPAIPTAWPQTASGKIRKVELREVAGDLARRGIGRVTSA